MIYCKTINEAVERLYALNVGVIGQGNERHERPHKPVLLLAVLDLIALGQAHPSHVSWSNDLRLRFNCYFEVVQKANDQNTAENPFLYLRNDKFWEPVEITGGIERPLETTPSVAQAINRSVFARFVGGMEQLLLFPEQRLKLRDALTARFFPGERNRLAALFQEPAVASPINEEKCRCKETEAEDDGPGRNPAFRRMVLKVYDFQCAACGLRIKLPDADMTFVDGSHIIPFKESYNDHPTNGLALCKNHHWAMDRFLIVPTPEGFWNTSPRLLAMRSPGEAALLALQGQPVMPPHDEAFRPDPVSLHWRTVRLYV